MASELATLLAKAREDKVFSAAAWSVGTADGVLDRGLLGTTAWDGPPVRADSVWDLASVTKPITGLAVLALADRGVLDIDARLTEYLPAWREKGGITVRQLLTHTSGLPGGTPLYREHRTREALLDAIRFGPLRTAPGARVEYSSQGFIVLGLIAEAVGGTPLDRLVAELVTAPAGMTGTGFSPAEPARAVATEYCPWRGQVVRGQVHDENAVVLGGICGHAGLFGTLADLETLGRVLVAGAAPLLEPRTHEEAISWQTRGLNLRRGLAWQGLDVPGSPVGTALGRRSYGHTGFTGTSLFVDPDAGRYFVLLTNRVHPARTGTGIERVRREFHAAAVALPDPAR